MIRFRMMTVFKTDMRSMAAAFSSNKWEDLRKQARQLENEIDMKLISYSKLGTSSTYTSGASSPTSKPDGYEAVPLLNSTSSEHMFETMGLEIEQLLAKLTSVNDSMSELMESVGPGANPALLHTAQRHRDILQDYGHEFQKTRANVRARREREDLLGSVRKDIEAYKSSSLNNRKMEIYMKENEHARSSDRLLDDQIGVAISTKHALQSQRGFMKQINTKMTTLANKYPAINNLIHKTNFRKRRDSIILGAVISTCLILLLLYAFH